MFVSAMNFFAIHVLVIHCTCVIAGEKFCDTQTRLLNDGNRIPSIALGTYLPYLSDRKRATQAVIWAIEAGYRHIDTAALYLSEDLVGEAINDVTRRGIVAREELFITTKLPFTVGTREQVVPAVEDILSRMQLDYLDLCLIHNPRNVLGVKDHDYVEIWKGLEDVQVLGLSVSIGVSNFNSTNINKLLANCTTVPAVNEIEVNLVYTDQELVAYCQNLGIVVMGYAPFAFMVPRPIINLTFPPYFDDPMLVNIAKKYGVKTNQVVLRYQIDRGIIPIPASLDKEHIESNIDIFGFSLNEKEIIKINEFDKNVKVYYIDYNGLADVTRDAFLNGTEYIRSHKLTAYYKILNSMPQKISASLPYE